MEPVSIVGILAAASVINNLITAAGKHDIETCVNAYYADKFNGERHGSPSKTFMACMATAYPETFKAVKQRYKPAAEAGSSA